MFKHIAVAVTSLFALSAQAAPFDTTISGVKFSFPADDEWLSSMFSYDGGLYNGTLAISHSVGLEPAAPFRVDFQSSLRDVFITSQVDISYPGIPAYSVMFSMPSLSLETSAVGGVKRPGVHYYEYSPTYNGVVGSLSIDFAQAFGGFGLAPAQGTNCASFSCMEPFELPKKMVLTFRIGQTAPIPEPENIALALAGLMTAAVARRRTRQMAAT